MSVRTVRFNRREESMLKTVLSCYAVDFSTCVKGLIMEKMEDLYDIGCIKRLKEKMRSDYLSAKDISDSYKN